jgi:hypothetical protein
LYKNTTKNPAVQQFSPFCNCVGFSFGTNWKINAAPIPLRPEKKAGYSSLVAGEIPVEKVTFIT